MTGLTTLTALKKLHHGISQGLRDSPNFALSPFISWHVVVSLILASAWIICCGLLFNVYVSVLLVALLLSTMLFFLADAWLSLREKSNSVTDILDIIQKFSSTHEPHGVNCRKPGFYLSETYPSSTSVSMQRVYRNGQVVSVSHTLLVEGDIILLSPGEEAPTASTSLTGDVKLKKGDVFTDKTDHNKHDPEKECVIESAKLSTLFTVTNTDYETCVRDFLRTTRLPGSLCLEIRTLLRILNTRFAPVITVFSVCAAILQYNYYSSGSEIEAVLVTILPLLPAIYPLYYMVAYYISSAIVIITCLDAKGNESQDPMKTPDNNINNNTKNETSNVRTVERTLRVTSEILTGKLYRYLPRNSNIFDTLSAVTVLCTINKEGILSRANPHVERIMLLDPAKPESESNESEGLQTVQEDTASENVTDRKRLLSTTSVQVFESDPLLPLKTGSCPNIRSHVEDGSKESRSLSGSAVVGSKLSDDFGSELEVRKSDTDLEIGVKTVSKNVRKTKMWLPRLSKKRPHRSDELSENKDGKNASDETMVDCDQKSGESDPEIVKDSDVEMCPTLGETKVKKKKKLFWQMMKKSRYRLLSTTEQNPRTQTPTESLHSSSASLSDDFIVVLSVSLSKHSPFGISFDCTDLKQLQGSLKPVGLAVLLNNLCRDSSNVTTSHLNYISVHTFCGLSYRLPLPIDYCNCVLGREIGFTRTALLQYQKISTVVTYVPCTGEMGGVRTKRNPTENISPLTCIVSSVVMDKTTQRRHLVSYGTAPFMLKCCYHFWNGKEVLPLLPEHRARVLEFYNQNRLTSHCFVVSYRPLLATEIFPQNDVFLALPKGYGFLDQLCSTTLDPAENLLKLQSCQTFLGVLCAQFQPKHDMVSSIETLVAANIRFVHFSYDNELRSRAFGTKLGLETGWNCHISLAEGDFDNFSVDSSPSADEADFHFYYCKARLPQGIKDIRPHLKNVDNVPLLVPLFTSCTPSAIAEMICIMQENKELVCCVGSSLQFNNFSIFLQADSSIGMIPHLPQHCLISGIKEMNLPWASGDYLRPPEPEDFVGVNCLHLTSILNTLPCSLLVSRDRVQLELLIRAARTTVVAVKQSGYLSLCMYGALSLLALIHQFFLPPPISLYGCLYVCLIVVPILASTPFTINQDCKIMELHTGKREASVTENIGRNAKYFLLRFASLFLFLPLSSAMSLHLLCPDCSFLPSDASVERFSDHEIALVQLYNCLLIVCILSVNSFTFAHRTQPINFNYFLLTATKCTALIPLSCFIFTLLMVVIAANVCGLQTPPYSLICAISLLPPLQFALSELSKMYDRRLFTRDQRRQKLKFGTKLGMNSPF